MAQPPPQVLELNRLMLIEDIMIHGSLPHSGGSRRPSQSRSLRSALRPRQQPSQLPPPEQQGLDEWEIGARFYHEIEMRLREAGGTYRPPFRTRIEDDTPIVPHAAAMFVCDEASLWLDAPFPRKWVAELAERANVIYQHHAGFRRLLRKPGNAGRDWLVAFMRHWLSALLASRCPDLAERLPAAYAIGRDLPTPPEAVRKNSSAASTE